MAKLYWRVKRDGKWTWLSATADNIEWPGSCRTEISEILDEFRYLEEEE